MKFTFQAYTFGSRTFASVTWAGEGAAPAPEVSVLVDLFCHPFTEAAHFQAFVTAMDLYIATPALLSASDLTYLVETVGDEGDTDLTEEHRDRWLTYLVRENLPTATRCPFGEQNPTTFAQSDPLGLATSALDSRKVVIVDPLNPSAVNVTRGTNTCTTQAGESAGNLFSGDNYAQPLWANLLSLDEQNWDTPSATIRRFPADVAGAPVTIYVRHDPAGQVLDKEIGLFKNSGVGGHANRKIIIRGYPGDTARPLVYTGSSVIEALPVGAGGQIVGSIGKYRLKYAFSFFRAVSWVGIEAVGYRGAPPNRIFAHQLFRGSSLIKYRDCVKRDFQGIDPNAADAGVYPDWVDSQWANRRHMTTGATVNPGNDTGGDDQTRTAIKLEGAFSTVFRCDLRRGPSESPPRPDGDVPGSSETCFGDTIYINAPDCKIQRNRFTGRVPHGHIVPKASALRLLVEDNDVSNEDHSCIGAGGDGAIVRRNRIHTYGRQIISNGHAGIQLTNSSNVLITENVIWHDGEEAQPNGIQISTSTDAASVADGNEVSYNIVFGAGIRLTVAAPAVVGSVSNTDIHHNVIIDLSHYAKTWAAGRLNAPITFDFGDGPANNAYGNACHDNLIARLDTDPAMMRSASVLLGATTAYGINGQPVGGGTVYPLWANNTTVDLTAGFPVYEAACVLNGSSQYLSIAGGPNPLDTAFTVVAWVKPDVITGTRTILGKSSWSTNDRSWYLEIRQNLTVCNLWFYMSSDGLATASVNTSVDAPATFHANQWNMVGGVHDPVANTIRAYTNGTLTAPVTHNGGAFNSSAPFRMGATGNAGATEKFDGSIQHVMFFLAVLTEQQLFWLYNHHKGRLYSELVDSTDEDNPGISNLVSYWELDETGSAARLDSKGSNHLTPTGDPVSGVGGVLSASQPAFPALFTDPANGDFSLLAGSPVSWLPAGTPLLATPAWDAYDAIDVLCYVAKHLCGDVHISAQYQAKSGISAQFEAVASISPQYIAASAIMECCD